MNIFKTVWKDWKWAIIITALAIVIAVYLLIIHGGIDFTEQWNIWIGAFVSFTLIILALTIWISERLNDTRNSLPKRLTVHFIKDDKYVMTCHEAYLAGISDIRAWGQQIGYQMANGSLSFYPYITQCEKPTLSKNKDYLLFEVRFYLKEYPDTNLRLKNEYLVWIDNQDKSPKNKIWYEPNQPCKPLSIKEIEKRLMQSP